MNLEDAVLVAIAKGVCDPKSIAKRLNVSLDDVNVAIDNLMAEGLIVKKVKGLIFKKEVYKLTKRGFERVEVIREKMKEIAKEIKTAYECGDKVWLERLYNEYYYLIPLMIMSDLIDAIWLSTLLSDLGMHDFEGFIFF